MLTASGSCFPWGLWSCLLKWIWRVYTPGSQCLLGPDAVATGSPSAHLPHTWWEVWGDVQFTLSPPDPCRPRRGCPAPCLGPLDPDHEGGGDRSQQVSPTISQAIPWLQDQLPAAPPGPALSAQAMLHHQEAQHLLLCAGPPSPQVCPNKTLWVNQNQNQNKKIF